MRPSVALKTLRDARRGFAWWSLGLAGLVALIVAVYPSVRDNPALDRLVQDYPEVLQAFIGFGGQIDYVSAAGYLGSELYSFMVPLLFLLVAVGGGARSLAGEEEQGTLDLLLAQPVSRRRVALEKLAALTVELAAIAAVLWASLWVGVRVVGMSISGLHLAAATSSAGLLALAFGAVALLVGAAGGKRARSIGVTAAAAVAAYLVNSLAPLVEALEPAQKASPFYHYAVSDPLRRGLEPVHVLVLIGIAVGAAVLTPYAFDRRDIASS